MRDGSKMLLIGAAAQRPNGEPIAQRPPDSLSTIFVATCHARDRFRLLWEDVLQAPALRLEPNRVFWGLRVLLWVYEITVDEFVPSTRPKRAKMPSLIDHGYVRREVSYLSVF